MDERLRRRNRRLAWLLGAAALIIGVVSVGFWMRIAEAIS